MTEFWNASLRKLKGKNILTLVEDIMRKVTAIYGTRRLAADKWSSKIPPMVKKKIDRCISYSQNLRLYKSRNRTYEIVPDTYADIVNILQKTCDCGYWKFCGIPREHAIRCLGHSETVANLLDNYMTKDF